MTLLIGSLAMGLILSLLALGVLFSFRIVAFRDLTVDGSLTLGGYGGGTGGSSVTVNHLTVGRVPEGALVLKPNSEGLAAAQTIRLTLRDPDFVTASRLTSSVNTLLGDGASRAVDAAKIGGRRIVVRRARAGEQRRLLAAEGTAAHNRHPRGQQFFLPGLANRVI